MKRVHLSQKICSVCGKADRVGYNRPHSLHKTKRVVRPNLQKVNGRIICTKCLKTERRKKKLKLKKSPA